MAFGAALTQRLVQVATQAAAAGHGEKESVYSAACAELSMSRATLLRKLNEVTVKQKRKRRIDAGTSQVTRDEAKVISAALMATLRKSATKRLMSVEQAVDMMRANGEVRCERCDAETGELIKLSTSTIIRALRTYRLHPDQLLRPEPAKELRSLHPNHVWQIDASLCVLYYLNARSAKESGLQVMEYSRFYKNKPANVAKIAADRVWSYEVTDHYSGSVFVNYVMGAESGINLAESFIRAICKRDGDPMHGVPTILMMDMGSANTSGLFKNLARRLDVELIAHMPGNARATGQVEQARNLIERNFESGLRFQPVADLDDLNAKVRLWSRWFNATKSHSRHGKSRTDMWLTINESQLRIAPSAELCRELLTHEPESRKVTDMLTVSFKGNEYDVSSVPRVMVGESLNVTYSPYALDAAMIVDCDAEGNELLHSVPVVVRNEAGFRDDANVIGQEYTRHASTEAELNRREVEEITYGVDTRAEIDAAKKAKALPLGGRIDPLKQVTDTTLPDYMPRRGTTLDISTRTTQQPERVLSLFEAAAELARQGVAMDGDKNRQVASWFPEGVPESEVNGLVQRLSVRASLKVVGG